MLPRAATENESEQADVTAIALRGVKRAWRRMRGRNWGRAWQDDVGPAVNDIVYAAQETAAVSSEAYIGSVLTELGIESTVPTSVNTDLLVGVAGDGRPVDTLTQGAVYQAVGAAYGPGSTDLQPNYDRALGHAEMWLEGIVTTLIADTARASERTSIAQRTWVTGYVRMVELGACSRCVILAGKFYLHNAGFKRHPRCRCRHIPASENVAGDMLTNPDAYFRSLPTAAELSEQYPNLTVTMRREAGLRSQEDVFTSAGAEAVRLGADVSQVVNARRGMQTAQVYGQKALVTTEGTTARGVAGKSLGELGKVAGERYRRSNVPRLMPETILANSDTPEEALRLLKRFGYVL